LQRVGTNYKRGVRVCAEGGDGEGFTRFVLLVKKKAANAQILRAAIYKTKLRCTGVIQIDSNCKRIARKLIIPLFTAVPRP
jgi:hypothetical protein